MKSQDTTDLNAINARLEKLERQIQEIRTLVGPFGVGFPDGSMLVQTIHGIKYFIDPNDEIMAPQLVIYRQWEADLSTYMANSATPETVFLDVGSNFGYFTCLVAAHIGNHGKGQVIAVEANPHMLRLLRKNIGVNWSMAPVEVVDCAAADREGYLEFVVPASRAANASLASTAIAPDAEKFIVKTRSVDQITKGRAIDVCKIDVEGFESMVLQGAEQTIARSPDINIVIEWSVDQMQTAGFAPLDLLQLFKRYGLTTYHLPPSRFISNAEWEQLRIPEATLPVTAYDNILLRRRA